MSKLWFGLQVAVLGMGIVFVALIILSYLTSQLSKVSNGKKEAAVTEGKIERVGKPNLYQAKIATQNNNIAKKEGDGLTPELIAVITAAVYESLGTTKYRITAIREIPKDKAPLWAQAGRMEQMKSLLN
jgi:sodium pump decarboxylase gamma subunit